MLSKNDLLGAPAKPLAKPRNLLLDSFFYDIKALSASELTEMSTSPDHEGAVIVVSPAKSNRKIRLYWNATEMLNRERNSIRGVAVAGVGSSIVGTAALARNVADAYDFDVAGVISGYGASDLLTEAMGGWFFYGYTDRFRHQLEIQIEKAAQFMPAIAGISLDGLDLITRDARDNSIPRQLDTGTLLDILMANPDQLAVVVGHSKGALLMDFVLEQFTRRMAGSDHRYYDELHVVTVGAVIGVPKNFKRTSQIIGKLDWFGGMNSIPDLLRDKDPETQPKYIENAGHHLNREVPYNLSLVNALGKHVPLH
jgi:hypothetical protein